MTPPMPFPTSVAALDVPPMPLSGHPLLVFLLQLGVLLAAAFLLGRLAMRLGMPAIVGELAVGIILGPSLLGHLVPVVGQWLLPANLPQLDAVAQLGVLLLVAITGMHLDMTLIRRRGGTALTVSAAGLVLPLALGIGAGFLLPGWLRAPGAEPVLFALFLGVAMCVSAIPVIAKTLIDMRLIHRNVGQLILVSGTIDDTFGWLVLSVISAVATSGLHASQVALAVATLCAVLLAAAVAGRFVVRPVMGMARGADGASMTLTVMLVVLAAAGTHALGLEAVLGAFLVGMLVRAHVGKTAPSWMTSLETIVLSVFAPLFFAAAGLRMDLTALADPGVLLTAVVVVVLAIVGKFLGAAIGGFLSKLTVWESVALGAGMNARGVVEVITAMIGVRLGLLTTEAYTIIVLVAVVTSVMAPPVLRLAMRRVDHTVEERQAVESRSVTA
ncbi:cation:proton antiporter [Nonomuraea sp. 3N208]|uniref:cation:proton antiporter n=1 Tax=Nonomuraea sp. 3N208 TaxID=3457421 RepID=UPI003FD581A7